MNKILSRYTLLSLSTLLSLCIFTAPYVFATTMTRTDTEITSQLYHQLSHEKSLPLLKIKPLVIHGVVKLQGMVNSVHQAIALIELTKKIEGIKEIDTSHLILKSTKKPLLVTDDLYINDKIKCIYEKNKVFGWLI